MVSALRYNQPTHSGNLIYKPTGAITPVMLTETKAYWVTTRRQLYKKKNGVPRGPGGGGSLWMLDIGSIEPKDK